MDYQLIKPIKEHFTPLEQILTNRGIKYEDIEHYLNVSEEDNLSPLLLDNIEKAAQLIIKHLDGDGMIYIQVDSDCDGYTSSALLLNYLHAQFPTSMSKFMYKFHDGKIHGIKSESIPDEVTLVIAPDSSSNDYDEHEKLANRGIDVLVIDHHLADKVSEYACVVNNQLCDYPTKSLSGVGVVYKVCQFMDTICGTALADNYLDIVGIGLVGDMMDIRDFETHYLVS